VSTPLSQAGGSVRISGGHDESMALVDEPFNRGSFAGIQEPPQIL
jgi:hypothetical protein